MTGKRAPARGWLGVKTFRNRQFSDVLAWPKGDAGCGQCGANWVASRTPGQLAAGWGGGPPRAPPSPPGVLALPAGAAATRAPRVTPATASRVRARPPVKVLNIQISLHG